MNSISEERWGKDRFCK